jgi:hypothetical protein
MNARAWHYDKFREGMKNGIIDLDGGDKSLQDELLMQTFQFNNRNALQISSKKDMRAAGLKSPDYLDAAIYSYVDWFAMENMDEPQNGEKMAGDPDKVLERMMADFWADAGLPG